MFNRNLDGTPCPAGEYNKRPCPYRPELPIVVCQDFNMDPMRRELCHKIGNRFECFDEIFSRDCVTLRGAGYSLGPLLVPRGRLAIRRGRGGAPAQDDRRPTLKSPAHDLATKPIYQVQNEALKAYRDQLEDYNDDKARHDADLAEWKKSGKKRCEPMPEAPAEPVAMRYLVSDWYCRNAGCVA